MSAMRREYTPRLTRAQPWRGIVDWMWWPAARGAAFSGDWQALPGVWLVVVAIGAGMVLWERGRPDTGPRARRRRLFALAGWVTLWLALDWPVGTLAAGHLLSVRTTQYLVLSFVAVPLILLGLGPTGAPPRSRRVRALHLLSHPAVALPALAITLAWTHFPRAVDAMSPHPAGILAIDIAWLAAATIYWWRIVGPEPDARRMPYLGVMVCLVVPFLLTKVPGLVFAFRGEPFFTTFSAGSTTLGLTATVDQQLAGFLLWFVGSVMVVTALGVLFFRWQSEDRRMSHADSLAIPADPRALELLFAVPGAWPTLEAVVAAIGDALPDGAHGAELAFAYRPRRDGGADGATQVVLELHIALDAEREVALARRLERVVSECLSRLEPSERVAVATRFSFRLVTYGTRVG